MRICLESIPDPPTRLFFFEIFVWKYFMTIQTVVIDSFFYRGQTSALKSVKDSKEHIFQKPISFSIILFCEEDKETYSWVKSVWGPNMVDSTQLTIT